MAKAVSLNVHKNKLESHRKRALARDIQRGVEAMVREKDIRAFAFVGIASDGKAYTMWDTGACLPLWGFPDTISAVLKRDIETSEVVDDWRPALTVKGSTS